MLIDELKEKLPTGEMSLIWFGRYEDAVALEEHLAAPADVREFLATLNEFTLFDCIPLSDLLQATYGQKPFRFIADCFAPLPPFPRAIFEFARGGGKHAVLLEAEFINQPVEVDAYFLRERMLQREVGKIGEHPNIRLVRTSSERAILPDAKAVVTVSLISSSHDTVTFSDRFCSFIVGKSGELLTGAISSPHVNELTARMRFLPEEDSRLYESLLRIAVNELSITGMVLNLLGCKNAMIEDRPIPAKLQKARQRRGKLPMSEYKTLRLLLPGKQYAASPNASTAGENQKRLHLVRGRFANYSENGLFGKYKGIFWVPAHTRGNAEQGTIKKRYELSATA